MLREGKHVSLLLGLMRLSLLLGLWVAIVAVPLAGAQVVYPGGKGPGEGKHIVFIASDHEYRGEETCPALARILAKTHGFKCTVIFGVDEQGNIEPGSSKLPGMEALKEADLLVIFARFLSPSAEDMAHLTDYLGRGGPVVGLRTSSHAFKIGKGDANARYSFDWKGPEYEKGFGHQVLGNTWVGHYGRNHKQGTRIELVAAQKAHPILTGVPDVSFCHAGGYTGIAAEDFTVLATSQPLTTMDPGSAPAEGKVAMPSAWTRSYKSAAGKEARVFHSTQGASEDILDAGYRRLLINGIFWAAGLEAKITPQLGVDFVGPYQPTTFKFEGFVRGVKPADLGGFESPIMPKAK
jgi:type 1 glutamine amidotransferase